MLKDAAPHRTRISLLSDLSTICLMALAAAGDVYAAEIYRWIDGSGAVHYSEHPPPGVKPTRIESVPSISPLAQQQAASESKRLIDESNRRDAPQSFAQPGQEQEKNSERRSMASHIQFCNQARGELDWLQQPLAFYRKTERGDRVYIEDSARPAEIRRLRDVVLTQCSDGATSEAAAKRRSESRPPPECLAAVRKLQDLNVRGTGVSAQDSKQAREAAQRSCRGFTEGS